MREAAGRGCWEGEAGAGGDGAGLGAEQLVEEEVAGLGIRRERVEAWNKGRREGWPWPVWRRILKTVLVHAARGAGRRRGRRVGAGMASLAEAVE
jgi:hypothetical protein